MGVGKYTSNAAIQGDMGWIFPSQRQWINVTRYWCRLMNMDNTRVNKRIFLWALNKSGPQVKNWCYRIKTFYRQQSMSHLFNPTYVFNVKSIVGDLQVVLSEHYEVQWYAKLTQVEAWNGQGKNKLRTYRLFKKDFLTEAYLKSILNFKHRSAIAKFRCGVAPIRLETGRYEHLNVDERICPICKTEVE